LRRHAVSGEGQQVANVETVVSHKAMAGRTLGRLPFDNTYARLPQAYHARRNPTPFSASPYLVHANPEPAALNDLDPEQFARPEFVALFGGSALAPGMEPLAMLCAGHQFSVYEPQLGDGRAILLDEATIKPLRAVEQGQEEFVPAARALIICRRR